MKSMLRRLGQLTSSFLVGGLLGCGPELAADPSSPELANLETQAEPLTVDPQVVTKLPAAGGTGGGAFTDSCPSGYVGTGLNVRSGDWIDQVQLICRKLNIDGTLGGTAYTPVRGGGGGGPASRSCANNQVMTAQMLGGESWMRQVGAQCSTATRLKNATGGFDSTLSPMGRAGALSTTACPAGSAITGIHGRAGDWVDQLGFTCSKLKSVASTISVTAGPQLHYQVSNVRINGAEPSTLVTSSQRFRLDLDYFIKDLGCSTCTDQLIVGVVSSAPGYSAPLACAYSGVPGSTGTSGRSSLEVMAPSQRGIYTLRVGIGLDSTSCNLNYWDWLGTPGPETIIGEIEIL